MSGRRRCGMCGQPLERRGRGRPRKFCSDRCRVAAWRQRRQAKPSARARGRTPARLDWATPPELFGELDREFRFELDACASADNATCARYFTSADDGLAQPWRGRVWLNPPYDRDLATWVQKAFQAAATGEAELVVCLLPVRTDTRWWHEYVSRGEVRFLRGRLRFSNARTPAPFASAIVVFRNGRAVTKPGGATAPSATPGTVSPGVDLPAAAINDASTPMKCPGGAATPRGRQQGGTP